MKTTNLISPAAFFLLFAVAGCSVTPEQAQVNRDNRLANQFPAAADRFGMHTVFGDRLSDLTVSYYPDRVSESEVLRRMGGFCARNGAGSFATIKERLPNLTRTTPLGDGSEILVQAFRIRCG